MESPVEKVATQTDIKQASPASDPPSLHDVQSKEIGVVLTHDEYHLATLGYKQEFVRCLGFFESWAATFTSMNFISGIPVLFGFVMYTGGPKAAFANWTMVGGLSCIVSLVMAELAASLPTTGEKSPCIGTGKTVLLFIQHSLTQIHKAASTSGATVSAGKNMGRS
jgi:hypothetical protein